MDIKILVAMHKPYELPTEEIYVPIHVGAVGKETLEGCIRDDGGENISVKNPNFCELTGLYFAWKNMECDALGLAHYRRHFKGASLQGMLSEAEAREILQDYDGIIPAKRRYYIESLESHYANTHDIKHLEMAKDIIKEQCPEYLPYVEKALKQTYGHMFNMFVLKKKWADEYLAWLFPILFELEKRVDASEMSGYNARFVGRVSELLFNGWLLFAYEKGLRVKEVKTMSPEPVDWPKKIKSFLAAKFLKKKYKESF